MSLNELAGKKTLLHFVARRTRGGKDAKGIGTRPRSATGLTRRTPLLDLCLRGVCVCGVSVWGIYEIRRSLTSIDLLCFFTTTDPAQGSQSASSARRNISVQE